MQVACDFGEVSNFVRSEHHNRPVEELKKIIPRFASAVIPLSESLMKDKIHIYSDAALFQNRRTRIGWGLDLKLTQIEALDVSIASIETSNIGSTPTTVRILKVLYLSKINFQNMPLDFLNF